MLPIKDDLERICRLATREPYQFSYVNLRTTDVNDMFFIGFSKRIRVNIAPDQMEADPYSNQRRDPVLGPTRGQFAQPAEAVVMKPGTRSAQMRQPPSDAHAGPHALQKQGKPLRQGRLSGL